MFAGFNSDMQVFNPKFIIKIYILISKKLKNILHSCWCLHINVLLHVGMRNRVGISQMSINWPNHRVHRATFSAPINYNILRVSTNTVDCSIQKLNINIKARLKLIQPRFRNLHVYVHTRTIVHTLCVIIRSR